jgi:hypothetical protein
MASGSSVRLRCHHIVALIANASELCCRCRTASANVRFTLTFDNGARSASSRAAAAGTPTCGYEPTRTAAMAAFAKSWRGE